jgi:hypothetical protein
MSTTEIKPDLKAALAFIQAITGERDPAVTWQTFDDSEAKRTALAGWKHGRLSNKAVRAWLLAKWKQGAGVYLMLARGDGKGRRAENAQPWTAAAVDLDGQPLPEAFPVEPDIIVATSKGRWHVYWLLERLEDAAAWSDLQARLAAFYGGDPKIIDAPRVLRVVGFHNRKKAQPFRVHVVGDLPDLETASAEGFLRKSLAEMVKAHPAIYKAPAERAKAKSREPIGELDTEDAIRDARDYLAGAPASIEGEGGNNTLIKVANRVIDFGTSKERAVDLLLEDWNDRCQPPWEDDEIERYVGNAWRYRQEPPGSKSIAAANAEFPLADAKFKKNPSGKALADVRNIKIALARLGVSLRYDRFADKYRIDGLDGFGPEFNDAAERRLRLQISERYQFTPSKDFMFDVCYDLAQSHAFDPVCDYCDKVQKTWDGEPRINTFLHKYGGADDTPYVRAVSALLFLSVVRRNRKPGSKFDEMIVLESEQGKNKSSMLMILALHENWFSDSFPLNADNRETLEHALGRIIVEVAELQGMKKADVEHVKAMLSRVSDRGRLAYARTPIEAPRRFIFVGTSNGRAYLQDATGNRRFWPVAITGFDLSKSVINYGRRLPSAKRKASRSAWIKRSMQPLASSRIAASRHTTTRSRTRCRASSGTGPAGSRRKTCGSCSAS